MKSLWIVQPYVPQYRVSFFQALRAELEQSDVQLNVISGRPVGAQAARGDAARPAWLHSVDSRVFTLSKRTLTLTRTSKHWRAADAVIVPHIGSSVDANEALLRQSTGGPPVGVWGHIASYTSKPNVVDAAVERWQMRTAKHVFAYTRSGASFARRCGVDASKITTVVNTFDTAMLEESFASVNEQALNAFRLKHGIPDGRIFAYIGGLDAGKRVDFLVEALDVLHVEAPDVHVVVAGRGEESSRLDRARERGQVTMVGYADSATKAVMLTMSRAIVNPGRVGLIAIDALVARKPVLTTDWPYHAPEFEYLQRPGDSIVADDSPVAFAKLVQAVGESDDSAGARTPTPIPRLDDMVANFAGGALKLMEIDQ